MFTFTLPSWWLLYDWEELGGGWELVGDQKVFSNGLSEINHFNDQHQVVRVTLHYTQDTITHFSVDHHPITAPHTDEVLGIIGDFT